jgi:hypothetical protein
LMKEFLSDNDVPRYAILSHTWEEDEVSFQQWESGNQLHSSTAGFAKIKKFGEQAARNGFEWVWADTCCIDKKSSAELTEAINAMFRWYKNAALCYVYFSDAIWSPDTGIMSLRLRESRWFTRGWTLQELIASTNIDFYSADWQKISTKEEICPLLSSITGIDEGVLKGTMALEDASIARRMSWASHRKTTRVEDQAYCLLGIFDINLPLIYGEGTKAFRRLQEAIMYTTHDQSLFAWGRIVDSPSGVINQDQELGHEPIPWKPIEEREKLLGLFAASPADFAESRDIAPLSHRYAHLLNRRRPPTVVNGGPLVDLVFHKDLVVAWYWDSPPVAQVDTAELVVLLCHIGAQENLLVGLVLHSWGDDYYCRTPELVRGELQGFVSQRWLESRTRTRHVMPHRPFKLLNGDVIIRRWSTSLKCVIVYSSRAPQSTKVPAWQRRWKDRVLRPCDYLLEHEEVVYFFDTKDHAGIGITLQRTSPDSDLGFLTIGVSHYEKDSKRSWPHRVPQHGKSFREPLYSHQMQLPADKWDFEVDGLVRVDAKVERIPLDGGGEVDILDFGMYALDKAGDKDKAKEDKGKEEDKEDKLETATEISKISSTEPEVKKKVKLKSRLAWRLRRTST